MNLQVQQQINTAKSPVMRNDRGFAYLTGKKVVLSWSYRKTLP
jgi:hypothetical protein